MKKMMQAGAGVFAAAAVVGVGAATASAATVAEWDQVAACESGGDWSINTGNGYHGGLQFSPSTWSGYGGGQYAATADQATKEQQIEIAENVLAGQGKGAWPSCGVGLSGPGGHTAPVVEAEPVAAPAVEAEAAPSVASEVTGLSDETLIEWADLLVPTVERIATDEFGIDATGLYPFLMDFIGR